MKNYTAIVALALALPAGFANADLPDDRPPLPQRDAVRTLPDRPPGGPGRAEHPPMPPIIAALDKNHDGVISEDEIASAAESLRTLDKNHDGKLTLDELMPPPPRPVRGDAVRPPLPPPDGLRDGKPRGDFAPPPVGPRDGEGPGRFAPPPVPPRDDASRGQSVPSRGDRPLPPPIPPRAERYAANRDGFMPLPVPPRPDFAPREGEVRERAMAAREGTRREFDRPPERVLREHSDARPEPRSDGILPPPMPPRDAARGPRDGERRPEMQRPRDGARPEAGPRGERPPGDAPRPEGERRPNPEG